MNPESRREDLPLEEELTAGAAAEAGTKALMEMHNTIAEHSTEYQNQVATGEEQALGIAVRNLMKKTENNPEVTNGVNEFLDSLMHQAAFGDTAQPLSANRVKELNAFLGEVKEELRWNAAGVAIEKAGGGKEKDLKEKGRSLDIGEAKWSKFYSDEHQKAIKGSTDLQNEVAGAQEAKLGIAVRQLMQRTNNNKELCENIYFVTSGLMLQAKTKHSENKLTTEGLGNYLHEKADQLRYDVGGGNRDASDRVRWQYTEQK